MRYRNIVTLITVVFTALTVNSQELTLSGCFALAEKNNENILIQSEKSTQALKRANQAKGAYRPSLNFLYLKDYRDTAGGVYSSDTDDSRFLLSQSLFEGKKRKSSLDYAKTDIVKQKYQAQAVIEALKIDIVSEFYQILQIDSDILNTQNTKKLLTDRLSELNERVRLGKSRESETLMVESQVSILDAQIEKSKGDRAKAVETLAHITGTDPDGLVLKDDAGIINSIESVEKYLLEIDNKSEIKSAAQDINLEEYNLQKQKSALAPALDFNGSYYTQRSGSSQNIKWDALFTLDVPFYQAGIVKAQIEEGFSRLNESKARFSLVKRSAQADVRRFYQSVVSSINQAAAYKNAYEKAEKSCQMQIRDYKYGLVNNLDVIQSMVTLLDSKKNLDRALIQTKNDKKLLDIISGR